METTLAFEAPIPAFETVASESIMPAVKVRTGPLRHQFVEALLTIVVMAWFAAALASIIGELHGVPSAPEAQPTATRDATMALPQASSLPGHIAGLRRTSVI